ncbi:anamorsin homolog [Osmia bicornis bicornis]|uniref:anamorsin homolog n=1 Tax=Osmia bicornis bicornis TaxID=1437191 RepID=UPI0010F99CA0|nr:anamorsin homolog [Osmia bicornis bicornis]
MIFLKENYSVLLILDSEISSNDITDFIATIKKYLKNAEQLTIASPKELEKSISKATFYDTIISIFKLSCPNYKSVFEECLRILKPGGILINYESFEQTENMLAVYEGRVSSLKLTGFKVKTQEELDTQKLKTHLHSVYNAMDKVCELVAEKPSFDIGSSVTLNFGKEKLSNVWKLDDVVDEELINEDELLDESDIKVNTFSLRVCSTTGKRKACKDCTCGLAEELSGKTVQKDTVKSSCGNCYLGDAFRCASCPYLGMPAFKPGEKVVLAETQLKAD